MVKFLDSFQPNVLQQRKLCAGAIYDRVAYYIVHNKVYQDSGILS